MRNHFSKAISSLTLCAAILSVTVGISPMADADTSSKISAEKLLEGIRLGTTLQHGKLDGHIRKDGNRTPLSLHLSGEDITFQFHTNNYLERLSHAAQRG